MEAFCGTNTSESAGKRLLQQVFGIGDRWWGFWVRNIGLSGVCVFASSVCSIVCDKHVIVGVLPSAAAATAL